MSEEDVRTIVIDNGSDTIKAGFSGDVDPKAIVSNVIGRLRRPVGGNAKDFYVGITQKCLWLFDNNSEVVAYYKLKRIQTVQTNSNYLFIRFISPEETIKILSQSEEIANYSLQILMSLSIICKTNSKF